MLNYLRVRNMAVIRDVAVEFTPGLNILTGETGAGKSILVDAVGLLMGDRADGLQIRHGEERAVVEGQFTPGEAARGLLGELALLADEEDGLVIRRELSARRANRVFINGHLSTLAVLRQLAALQLALHGQSRHLVLATPDSQRRYLDEAALADGAQAGLAAAWNEFSDASRSREEHAGRLASVARELEILRFQLHDIEGVAPLAGEDDSLRGEEKRLSSTRERAALLQGMMDELVDGDGSVLSGLASLGRRARELAALDEGAKGVAERLEGLRVEAEDLAHDLSTAMPDEIEQPERLEQVQERLMALQTLCRKYGGSLEEVLATAARLRTEIGDLEDGEGARSRLEAAERQAAVRFHDAAQGVGRQRARAARRLAGQVDKELASLELAQSRLRIDIEGAAPADGSQVEDVRQRGGPGGYGKVIFRFAAHAGEPPRDLARVASGGELSRLMLALTLVLDDPAQASGPRTLIFDEVDAGVGGETGTAIGQRLRRAADRQQVICVTHLPQVAAMAANHLHARKQTVAGRPDTVVRTLSREERVEELARMLGGGKTSKTALQHAESLLLHPDPGAEGTTKMRKQSLRRRRPAGSTTPWV